MASLGASLMVSVVSNAMHSVADNPGRQPTMMPSSAPRKPVGDRVDVEDAQIGLTELGETRQHDDIRLGQANQEDFLEHHGDGDAGAEADRRGGGDWRIVNGSPVDSARLILQRREWRS